jgi:hypothetical protein
LIEVALVIAKFWWFILRIGWRGANRIQLMYTMKLVVCW